MKKKTIKLGIIMLLIGLIIGLLVAAIVNKNSNGGNGIYGTKSYDITSFYDKEDLIIYLRNDSRKYYEIEETDKFIDYYKKVFGLSIVVIDCSELNKQSLDNIYDFTTIGDFARDFPYVYFKKGDNISLMHSCSTEFAFRDMLFRMGFLDNKDSLKDVLISNDEFKYVLNDSKYSLIFIGKEEEKKYIDYRKYLHDLSFKYDFNFYTNRLGTSDTDEISDFFWDKFKEKYDSSIIAIIGNGKIKSFAVVNVESDIDKFLKKNGYT